MGISEWIIFLGGIGGVPFHSIGYAILFYVVGLFIAHSVTGYLGLLLMNAFIYIVIVYFKQSEG
jgi:hypothetical protein